MVATRNHPKDFDPPATESPTKRSTRSSTAAPPSPTRSVAPRFTSTSTAIATTTASEATPANSVAKAAARAGAWTHTPSNLTLFWLALSLPLVIWDTGYVLLRPHSMPGGWLHAPLWTPYELYGRVDHVYGFKAYNAGYGWTAAQGWFNLLETTAYFVYLYLVFAYGQRDAVPGRGAPDVDALGELRKSRTLTGKVAATAILIAYSTTLVTFVKTALYWLIEAASGFDGIGHNDLTSLIFLWIIPNGAWLVFPAYMLYVMGAEIVEGLDTAVEGKKRR